MSPGEAIWTKDFAVATVEIRPFFNIIQKLNWYIKLEISPIES